MTAHSLKIVKLKVGVKGGTILAIDKVIRKTEKKVENRDVAQLDEIM